MKVADRVLFPATGFRLSDAIDYYRRMAKIILPHLRERPVSFKRYPDNIEGESFWEKDAPSFTPPWVKTAAVPRREGGPPIRYPIISNLRTLLWVVESGGIEIHPFLHRYPKIDQPTAVVFDLDPGEGADITSSCEVAIRLRDALAAVGFECLAKVSGSKGLQVFLPLNTPATYDVTSSFARFVAEELARAYPGEIVAKMTKRLRAGKVFIDWSQNADFKTTVGVYSLRAKRETPYVSVPVTWKEVESANRERLYLEPDAAIRRAQRLGDLFAAVLKIRQKLGDAPLSSRARRPTAAGGTPALPKPRSQSGRRLFILPKTEMGNELWIDFGGKFRRFILRPDRRGGGTLIAMPAGEFAIDPDYYRGKVPAEYEGRVDIEDIGSFEVIDGSPHSKRMTLFFDGKTLKGTWRLEKLTDERHRSWSFAPLS